MGSPRSSTTPRQKALSLLEGVEGGRRLDLAWEAVAPTLPPRDRRWVQEATFGVVRLRGRIDHLLAVHVRRGIDSVSPPLLRVLRLGAYQLLEMGSVPDYAAVSESVDLARGIGGRGGASFVNAVLRSVARGGYEAGRFPSFDEDPVRYLSTWGSHPAWMVERWVERMGPSLALQIVEAGNRIPSIWLRPLDLSPEDAAGRLQAAGIGAEVASGRSRSVRLDPGTDPLAAMGVVRGIIQDPAASAVVDFVGVRGGERLADLCAAPGGKGVALAALGARVVASDPSPVRLGRMRETMRRLGMPQRLVVARGESPPFSEVDVVLVDAPCTGTGTLARHPDARWRLGPDAPGHLARIQSAILDGAATIVGRGGLLVYSTCTLEEEENEEVVAAFLSRHGEFEAAEDRAGLKVLPDADRTDGAFAFRLRRAG
jgi:16S rRNA (cytosine967-C5)-methyltransferase